MFLSILICFWIVSFTEPFHKITKYEGYHDACVLPNEGITDPADYKYPQGYMCALRQKENFCSFEIKNIRNETKDVEIVQQGCSACQMRKTAKDSMCFFNQKKKNFDSIFCCCRTRFCLIQMQNDALRGNINKIEGQDGKSLCKLALYSNIHEQRWLIDSTVINEESNENRCHLSVIRTQHKLNETKIQNRPAVHFILKMGAGCRKKPGTGQYVSNSATNRSLYMCCEGNMCNAQLYRLIGFSILQNEIYKPEELNFLKLLKSQDVLFDQKPKKKTGIPIQYVFLFLIGCVAIFAVRRVPRLDRISQKEYLVPAPSSIFYTKQDEEDEKEEKEKVKKYEAKLTQQELVFRGLKKDIQMDDKKDDEKKKIYAGYGRIF